jgi:hypothetical protein
VLPSLPFDPEEMVQLIMQMDVRYVKFFFFFYYFFLFMHIDFFEVK